MSNWTKFFMIAFKYSCMGICAFCSVVNLYKGYAMTAVFNAASAVLIASIPLDLNKGDKV